MTTKHPRTLLTAGALALAALAGCSTPAPADAAAAPPIGRFASDNPGSVNVYWMPMPQGLVVVDAGRNVAGGRRVVDELRRTGRPVLAVLITHPHPDHVGGLGVLHEAFPQVPVYASAATAAWMRADPLGFYGLARQADPDYPAQLTYPDRTFEPGSSLDIGGVRFETAEFAPGESETATAFYEPATGTLFAGDLTDDRATPALLEGHTCGWLVDLGRLRSRFPDARTIHPGHGAPGVPAEQIDQQATYLRDIRALVRPALDAASPGGAEVDPGERSGIAAEMDRRYPDHPPVASLPDLPSVNIAAVARELAAEDPRASSPVVTPTTSAGGRFWLIFTFASTRLITSSTPTIARSCPATNAAGASSTDHGAGSAASCRSVSRRTSPSSHATSSCTRSSP